MLLRVLLFETHWMEENRSPLSNPTYYEIAAYILFIGAPLSFALFAINKKTFKKNKKKFHKEIVKEISKNDDKYIRGQHRIRIIKHVKDFSSLHLMKFSWVSRGIERAWEDRTHSLYT
jgi:hypothetical protein